MSWRSRALVVLAVTVLGAPAAHAQDKRVFNPPGLASNLPFSSGLQVGDMLWIAGTEGDISGDISEETRTALANIKQVLDMAGYKVDEVVQVTVYLKDIGDFAKMNAVYAAFFPTPRPTRTTVEVARLVGDARVEITAVAVHGRGGRAP